MIKDVNVPGGDRGCGPVGVGICLCSVTIAGLVTLAGAGPAHADDSVCVEAESTINIEAPMRIAREDGVPLSDKWPIVAGASAGAYLEIPQGSGNPPDVEKGYATVRFTIPGDAVYNLWCRVWWADECGNSVTMTIDDGPPFVVGQDSTFKCWHWIKMKRKLAQLDLAKGTHVLKIANREDGVRLDQILFTADSRYVPVGKERAAALEAPAPSAGDKVP